MTTYKLEYTDFEGEKTTLIKELQGDNSWENSLDDTLLIISNFLRSIGYSFDKLETTTSTEEKEESPLRKLKGFIKPEIGKECYGYGSLFTDELEGMRKQDYAIDLMERGIRESDECWRLETKKENNDCDSCGFNPDIRNGTPFCDACIFKFGSD